MDCINLKETSGNNGRRLENDSKGKKDQVEDRELSERNVRMEKTKKMTKLTTTNFPLTTGMSRVE